MHGSAYEFKGDILIVEGVYTYMLRYYSVTRPTMISSALLIIISSFVVLKIKEKFTLNYLKFLFNEYLVFCKNSSVSFYEIYLNVNSTTASDYSCL